jgi:TonB family protein
MKFKLLFIYQILFFCGSVFPQNDPLQIPIATVKTAPNADLPLSIANDSSGITDSLPPIDKIPQLITFVKADYPDSLVKKGIEGSVEFDLVISERGTVDSLAIVKSLHPVLDSCALKVVRSFLFSAAISQGKSIPVILRYVYTFTLNDVVVSIPQTINYFGEILEKGTRIPVSKCFVVVSFQDTVLPKKHGRNYACVDKTPEGIPLLRYLERIGKMNGQKLDYGNLVTTTDSLGRFSFIALPNGIIHVKIVAPDYKQFTTKIEIKKGKKSKVKYWLERDSFNQNEVVVYGSADEEEVESHSIDKQEIKRVAGFNGEAVKVIQALPGVSRPVYGGNETIIRGNDNENSKFYLDGLEIPYLYHDMSDDFGLNRGIVNGNILNSLELYSGGWGVRYGNALGGIIDMKTRPARSDKWHAMVDVNLKSCDLFFETPLWKNASVLASFRGNYFIEFVNFFQRRFLNEPSDMVRDFWDYSIRFDWRLLQNHHVFLSTIGAIDTAYWKSSYLGMQKGKKDSTQEAFSFGKTLRMGYLGWDWVITPKLDNMLRYSIRPSALRLRDNELYGVKNYKSEGNNKSLRNDIRDELHYKASERVGVTFGLDIRHASYTDTTKNYYKDWTNIYSNNIILGPYSAYISADWRPINKFILTSGLRYDYYPQLKYNGGWLPEFWNYGDKAVNNHTRFSGDPSFRLSGRYELNLKNSFTLSIGTYNQSPDSIILQMRTNDKLVTEKGSQFTLGHLWNISGLMSLKSEVYINYQWDRPRWATSEDLENNYNQYLFTDGKARMEGLELLLRRNQDKQFSGWISYSLAYSERYDFKDKKWVEYDYNVLNNFQIVVNYFFPGNRSIGLHFQYTDGYPYTPAVLQCYDATNFNYIATSGATNSKRHTPYYGLDLRYEKKWVNRMGVLTTYIEFIRLFHWLQFIKNNKGDALYHPGEMNLYKYDYSGFETMANFPMISFGITWEF